MDSVNSCCNTLIAPRQCLLWRRITISRQISEREEVESLATELMPTSVVSPSLGSPTVFKTVSASVAKGAGYRAHGLKGRGYPLFSLIRGKMGKKGLEEIVSRKGFPLN